MLAQKTFLAGCCDCKTVDLTMGKLFEVNMDIDPRILNKLTYVFPTFGMAKTSNPSAVHLAEKHYRDHKVARLNWPLFTAFIMSPPALTNK